MPGRQSRHQRQAGDRGDHDRDVRLDDLAQRACEREAEPLQRDQARLVDAEHPPQQALGRDFEDQRVLTEYPGAAQARDDQQRQRQGEPRLDCEREQRDERRRREYSDQPQPPGGRHEPDGHQLTHEHARRDGCEPPSCRPFGEPEIGDVRRSQRFGRDGARGHEPAEQQHAADARVGEHRRGAGERVPEDVHLAGLAPERRARPRGRAHDERRAEEAHAVQQQRAARRGQRDQQAARGVADDLRRLRHDAEEGAARDERSGGQDDDEQPIAHAAGDRRDEPEQEEQREQRPDRHRRARHERHDQRREQVAADHEAARRHAVDEAREQRAAEQVRDEGEREGEAREERRAAALEDEHRERDRRHDVAQHRDGVGREQRPELGHPQRVAVLAAAGGGRALGHLPAEPYCLRRYSAKPPPPLMGSHHARLSRYHATVSSSPWSNVTSGRQPRPCSLLVSSA